MRVLLGLFLIFAISAQADMLAQVFFQCRNSSNFFLGEDKRNISTCKKILQDMSKYFIENKELSYNLGKFTVYPEPLTKREESEIKQEIESALLRYFSTPAYPKKIKEDAFDDVRINVNLFQYNDQSNIYYGELEVAFKPRDKNGIEYPFQFKESLPYAFNRKSQLNDLKENITDIIKAIADEIFQTANEDLEEKTK